jgi:hypothetical protein
MRMVFIAEGCHFDIQSVVSDLLHAVSAVAL